MADDAMKTANAAMALAEQNDGWISRNGKTMQDFMNEVGKKFKEFESTVKEQSKTISGLQKEVAALKKKK